MKTIKIYLVIACAFALSSCVSSIAKTYDKISSKVSDDAYSRDLYWRESFKESILDDYLATGVKYEDPCAVLLGKEVTNIMNTTQAKKTGNAKEVILSDLWYYTADDSRYQKTELTKCVKSGKIKSFPKATLPISKK